MLSDLFEPEPAKHQIEIVYEIKGAFEDHEVYVWATLEHHTYETMHVKDSPIKSPSTRCSSCAPTSNAFDNAKRTSMRSKYNWRPGEL